jgi:hypothetical protein
LAPGKPVETCRFIGLDKEEKINVKIYYTVCDKLEYLQKLLEYYLSEVLAS